MRKHESIISRVFNFKYICKQIKDEYQFYQNIKSLFSIPPIIELEIKIRNMEQLKIH